MESNIIVWLVMGAFAIAVLEGVVYIVLAGIRLYLFIKQRLRRREIDRRIISRAKGSGIWDRKPIMLGGRALELKAREDFKMKRAPGETDVELRRRYMEAEKRKEDALREKEEKEANDELPEICRKCWNTACRADKKIRESKIENCKKQEEDWLEQISNLWAEEEKTNTPIEGGISNGEQ